MNNDNKEDIQRYNQEKNTKIFMIVLVIVTLCVAFTIGYVVHKNNAAKEQIRKENVMAQKAQKVRMDAFMGTMSEGKAANIAKRMGMKKYQTYIVDTKVDPKFRQLFEDKKKNNKDLPNINQKLVVYKVRDPHVNDYICMLIDTDTKQVSNVKTIPINAFNVNVYEAQQKYILTLKQENASPHPNLTKIKNALQEYQLQRDNPNNKELITVYDTTTN